MSLRPEEWAYLAEGGAHILFKYQGNQSLFKGKVLRIAKESPDGKPDELCVNYYTHLVKSYIGEEYSIEMELIKVDQGFLGSLSNIVDQEESRPAHRFGRSIDTSKSFCFIMDNLIRDDYRYSVEIKPKWGLKCTEAGKCKFCRLQSTKKYPVGDYCPVRFFGGSAVELEVSLLSLFNNPRNQLRIYEYGKPLHIFSDKSELRSRLLQILSADPIISRLRACQERLFLKYQSHTLDTNISNQEYYNQLHNELEQGELSCPLTAFLASISIEDSSLFLSFNLDSSSNWKIKIVDVDIKLPAKLKSYIAEHDYLRNNLSGFQGSFSLDQ